MTTAQYYAKARRHGYNAAAAYRLATTLVTWDAHDTGTQVRLRCVEECENYYDVFGAPEAYTDVHGRRVSATDARKEIDDLLDLHGCWFLVAEFSTDHGETWHVADTIGMCTGYVLSPYENGYVPDLMRAAMSAHAASAFANAI